MEDYNKGSFKNALETLEDLKKEKVLSEYELGLLNGLRSVENLILCEVSNTFKEKCKKDIEELEKEILKLHNNKNYKANYKTEWKEEMIFLQGKHRALKSALNYN